MNKKLQTIGKELSNLLTKKASDIERLEKEIAGIEADMDKCQAEMKKAAEAEDFEGYKKAATKKEYFQQRLEFVNGKLEASKTITPAGGSYADTRAAIIGAFQEDYDNLLKETAKAAQKAAAMETYLRNEFKEATDIINMLNELYGEDKGRAFSLVNYANGLHWSASLINSPVYNHTCERFPELKATK